MPIYVIIGVLGTFCPKILSNINICLWYRVYSKSAVELHIICMFQLNVSLYVHFTSIFLAEIFRICQKYNYSLKLPIFFLDWATPIFGQKDVLKFLGQLAQKLFPKNVYQDLYNGHAHLFQLELLCEIAIFVNETNVNSTVPLDCTICPVFWPKPVKLYIWGQNLNNSQNRPYVNLYIGSNLKHAKHWSCL